jgi:hypothetical protein
MSCDPRCHLASFAHLQGMAVLMGDKAKIYRATPHQSNSLRGRAVIVFEFNVDGCKCSGSVSGFVIATIFGPH